MLQCPTDGIPVTVTISSETMRRSVQSACGVGFTFEGIAPAICEVFAIKQGGLESGFIDLPVYRDEVANMVLTPPGRVSLEVVRPGASGSTNIPVTVTARRADLYLADAERVLEVSDSKLTLAPGHWEMSATAGPGQYVESIVNGFGSYYRRSRTEQPSDWFDVHIDAGRQARIRITVSEKAARSPATSWAMARAWLALLCSYGRLRMRHADR